MGSSWIYEKYFNLAVAILEARGSTDDNGDYGSFAGRADSELLKQSIEAAMPKRFLTANVLLFWSFFWRHRLFWFANNTFYFTDSS